MLKFVKWAFRTLFEVFLWINAIFCVLAGAAGGYALGATRIEYGGDSNAVWLIAGIVVGLIVGAVVGLLTNIFCGGLVATFLDIGNDTANIKAVNTKIQADIAALKGAAADIKASSADTAAVFQKMASRQASTAAANAGGTV